MRIGFPDCLVAGMAIWWCMAAPLAAVSVPGDYPSIQSALNDLMFGSLPSGTVIEVQPGTYMESLAYASSAKSFTLRGVGGAKNTVINASGTGEPGLKIRDTGAAIRIEGVTITGASGTVGGGLVFTRASPTLVKCIVEGNTTSNDGAGILLFTSSARIQDSTIRNNTAANAGGGLMIVSGSRPEILDSSVLNNISGSASAVGTGGGIQVNNSSPTIRSTVISGNRSTFAGGGIFVIGAFDSTYGTSLLTLEDSEISGNQAARSSPSRPPAEAGGIHIEGNTVARITRSWIKNNTANSGGGLNSYQARYEVTNSTIEGNHANGGYGGGLHAISGSPQGSVMVLTDSVVRNNDALKAGGLLVAGASCGSGGVCATLTIHGSLIDNNTASAQGGGVSVSDAVLTVSSSQVLRNRVTAQSDGGYGGGFRIISSTASITGTTIAGNSAGERGGGIFVDNNTHLTVDHSNIYENSTTASNGGGGIFVGSQGPPTGSIQNSQIADNSDFQIREQSCPTGVPAPIMTYRFNSITNPGPDRIYKSPCVPPGEVTSITVFNSLSPGAKTVGNDTRSPSFSSFAAMPLQAPAVLAWCVARTDTVEITNFGEAPGPTGSTVVAPRCTTTYRLDSISATVAGTDSVAPPTGCTGTQETLYDQVLYGAQAFEAGQLFEVERVTLLQGANITISAGETIVFREPFAVEAGATLRTQVDPCLCDQD